MSPADVLLARCRLGPLELPNRVALSPMTRTSAEADGRPNERMVRYYARFARGGFGLLITEGTYTDEAYSQGYLHQPGLTREAHEEGWRAVVEAVHAAGARIVLQLMHAGALSQGNVYRRETAGPSAVQPKGQQLGAYGGTGPYPVPRELTLEDIGEVLRGFVDTAVRARRVGFDGVEVHGANGYLLDQFLTEDTNRRTDAFGGPVEARIRLTVEVTRAIREAVGPGFLLGVRISQGKVNDPTHKWAGGEEDARVVFRALATAQPDYLHITEHDATAPAFPGGGPTLTALARRESRLPVVVNGGLVEPAAAAGVLQRGEADVVAIGKGALTNHDWVRKVAAGQPLAPVSFAMLQPDATIKDFELQ